MIKDRFNAKKLLYCGLFLWLVINLIQAFFTEIHEDEAYYALFGEHLAWGYYDHPPMVALMTFLSSQLFSGILGVRFFTVVASCLTLLIAWKIASTDDVVGGSCIDCFVVPPRNDAKRQTDSPRPPLRGGSAKRAILYFTLAYSVVIFNLYGFITTPDAGLLLFSALFLFIYQRYCSNPSWKNALLMGVVMALMVYSKYHAFLLLGLIVLSNFRMLRDGKFWVACLVALALLTPHVLWQVEADFPSLRYHLSGRSEPFRWSYFLEYLPNQLLVFNPFVFGSLVYVLVKHKARDRFERGLWFVFIGFFAFFWLMSFRGHVEPHWTAVGAISAVVLLYRYAWIDSKLMKYVKFTIAPSLILIAALRIVLLTPTAAIFGFCKDKPHYEAIASEANNHPVVFQGSFQQPALYHYFTGNESSTLCCYYDRKTQYDLWQFDTAWIGKPVYVYGHYFTENFQTANRLMMDFQITNDSNQHPLVISTNDIIQIDFTIYNPSSQTVEFQYEMIPRLLLLDDNTARYCTFAPIPSLSPKAIYTGHLTTQLGPNTNIGKNHLLLCIGDRIAFFGERNKAVEVMVTEP